MLSSLKIVLFFCFALLLTACPPASPFMFESPLDNAVTRQPVSCSEILSAELIDFPFDQLTLQETVLWIREIYGIDPRQDTAHSAPIQYLRWEQGEKRYTVDFIREQNAGGVTITWVNRPTVMELLGCIGDPTHYRSWIEPNQGINYTDLELWYPSLGYEFLGYTPDPLPSITDSSMLLSSLTYVRPGSLEQVVGRVFSSEIGSDRHNIVMARLRVWPGALDQIEIDRESSRND